MVESVRWKNMEGMAMHRDKECVWYKCKEGISVGKHMEKG